MMRVLAGLLAVGCVATVIARGLAGPLDFTILSCMACGLLFGVYAVGGQPMLNKLLGKKGP
jgi:hypothetical protein